MKHETFMVADDLSSYPTEPFNFAIHQKGGRTLPVWWHLNGLPLMFSGYCTNKTSAIAEVPHNGSDRRSLWCGGRRDKGMHKRIEDIAADDEG